MRGILCSLIVVQAVFLDAKKPNIILIITDDQDVALYGLDPMKKTLNLIGNQGAIFLNAFTSTPICCPSRSSILTGLYQMNHKVLNNSVEGGCSSTEWQSKLEPKAFPVLLQKAGYNSIYVGKYLNQYGNHACGGPGHVPEGWNSWVGLMGNSKYYNYSLSINGTRNDDFKDEYFTNVIEKFAVEFLENNENSENPFLMVLAPPAPHSPFTPDDKHSGRFSWAKVPRQPHFNYPNNANKHWLVRTKPKSLNDTTLKHLDMVFSKRWETLMSVDDLVESVYRKLISIKQLDNTYILFTSDNGFHMGQFALPYDKRHMYEFDIRVPLLVRGPGIPSKSIVGSPAVLIDIAPTLYHIAGIKGPPTDGKSFLPLTSEKGREFFIEYHGEGSHKPNHDCPWADGNLSNCSPEMECKCEDSRNNTYLCLRSISRLNDYIYCRFHDNDFFEEFYDLQKDPYQLENIARNISVEKREILNQKLQLIADLSIKD